jgi:hypothetical protein
MVWTRERRKIWAKNWVRIPYFPEWSVDEWIDEKFPCISSSCLENNNAYKHHTEVFSGLHYTIRWVTRSIDRSLPHPQAYSALGFLSAERAFFTGSSSSAA